MVGETKYKSLFVDIIPRFYTFLNPLYLVGICVNGAPLVFRVHRILDSGTDVKPDKTRRDIFVWAYIYVGRSSEIIDDNERPIRYTCVREDTKFLRHNHSLLRMIIIIPN